MNIHWLQHVPFEGLGLINDWLNQQNVNVTSTRLYLDEKLPSVDSFDALIVMGGPMSANDEDKYPWLKDELALIKQVYEQGKPLLGICLGAQLIVKSLGGEVFPAVEKEIGWWPLSSNYSLFDGLQPLHWHGETFSLPSLVSQTDKSNKLVRIASSEITPNQAFICGDNLLGLQFHLESNVATLNDMITHCKHELVDDKVTNAQSEQNNTIVPKAESALHAKIQSVEQLLQGYQQAQAQQHRNKDVLFTLLDAWHSGDLYELLH